MFPYYLAIGMSSDEFWNKDPKLAEFYRKSDEMKRQRTSNEQWQQGLYIYHAVSTVIGNALKKKGTAPYEYMSEPFRVIPETEEEKAIKAEKEKKKLIEYLNRLASKSGSEVLGPSI